MTKVVIKFDRERPLEIDANVFAESERDVGSSMLEKIASRKLGFLDIRAILYHALRREDPDLSVEQAGSFITGETLPKITKAINQALLDFFGKKS